MRRLRVGYVPLTGAAVLITAAERGFGEAEGLTLDLVREASWASIRDKLIYGTGKHDRCNQACVRSIFPGEDVAGYLEAFSAPLA